MDRQSGGIAIECNGLSKMYGEVQALKDLDLKISSGSIFGFIGRNGAGKTTTIRLLTGLAQPTRGQAIVEGQEVLEGNGAARRKFGYLPQSPGFYSWMSPIEFLDYVGGIYHMPAKERKQRIDEVLLLVGLQDARKRRIAGFSGGMLQRLGIAQAVLHKPPVLFLDEPTSALDPAGRYEVLELIDSMRGDVTVFLSSHILSDVERICDTLGIIHQGELLFVTGRDDLLSNYAVDAVGLDFEGKDEDSKSLFEKLSLLDWISEVKHTDDGMIVLIQDVERAKAELFPLIMNSGLDIRRYEWVKPSLEDIFLQVSAE